MKRESRVQGELFSEFTASKQKRARLRRRKTVKPPKEIGQYEPDIPPAKVSINL
jgi:hypothetical protein